MAASPEEVVKDIEELDAQVTKVLQYFECSHRNSEYGNCWDCQNTGYEPTSQEEQDYISALLELQRAKRGLHQ